MIDFLDLFFINSCIGNYIIFFRENSVGHCSIWSTICWHEIGWCHFDIDWFLLGNVSKQLARLHNAVATVSSPFTTTFLFCRFDCFSSVSILKYFSILFFIFDLFFPNENSFRFTSDIFLPLRVSEKVSIPHFCLEIVFLSFFFSLSSCVQHNISSHAKKERTQEERKKRE